MQLDINSLLTLDQREQLTEAAASTFTAAAVGDPGDEIEALRDFRDQAMEVLGIESDDDDDDDDEEPEVETPASTKTWEAKRAEEIRPGQEVIYDEMRHRVVSTDGDHKSMSIENQHGQIIPLRNEERVLIARSTQE